MRLDPNFREFFESLTAHEVRYLVVGGYALGFHGAPRYTGDIDVWIEPTPENAARVVSAFVDFGFASLGLDAEAFSQPGQVIQIGYPPLRIDVMTSPSGVEFGPCYEARLIGDADGLAVDVIGLDCLKENKAASGRPQDLADLERLP